MTIEKLDIRHFKLTNGEEIIGLVNNATENAYIIERPAVVHVSNLGVYMFSSWFPFSEQNLFKILKSSIVMQSGIIEESKHSYIRFCTREDEAGLDNIEDDYLDDTDEEEWYASGTDHVGKETVH